MDISFALYMDQFNKWIWGPPLVFLLVGGGSFLLIYSRFIPFKYFKHAIDILRGKFDDKDDPGQLTHYQALSSAIAATVGMGNISGVAIAIAMGGPGAIFWMWMSAIVGMATKFFTCTLAVMYRGEDSEGNVKGGPMYVITKGLGEKWKFLAAFFAIAGLIGTMPAFQSNQLTQTIIDVFKLSGTRDKEILFMVFGFAITYITMVKLIIGIVIAVIVSSVIFGGIERIGQVAGKLVPGMVVIYFLAVVTILIISYEAVPATFMLIIKDAFTGQAVLGGALGALIMTGVKRAAFSNEAGLGTAPMMHGTAKTKEPIREGLVAMLGPFIDTIIVCTLTALAILVTGAWEQKEKGGISITLDAFNEVLPYNIGSGILLICVLIFAFSTLFTYSYYGTTCLSYLTNAKIGRYYRHFYIFSIVGASVVKLDMLIDVIDNAYALMAIPTIISTLILAPKVRTAATKYFKELNG